MRILGFCVLVCFLFTGCATVTISTHTEIPRKYPDGLTGNKKVVITDFEELGGDCLKKEIKEYLEGTNKFVVFIQEKTDDRILDEFLEKEGIHLHFSGRMKNYRIFSSKGISSMAAAEIKVIDVYSGETLWSKETSVLVNSGLYEACKDLATKLLNEFLNHYVTLESGKSRVEKK